mgnify:CR=1 FL=1
MFNFKPMTYLWMSVFCFFMTFASAIMMLVVGDISFEVETYMWGFICYAVCGIGFFVIGMAKGLE